ncbi:MAG TPA: hypothetical protein QF753_07280 [Victivallales bacterium]|nr:hypothetical protein [Victivallales bacterium]
MNTIPSLVVNKILTSSLHDSAARVFLYLYSNSSENDRSIKISNGDLSYNLNMNIKTILRSLAQLRDCNYINVSGRTSNRVIKCQDPVLNSNEIKNPIKIKSDKNVIVEQFNKIDIQKLKSDKWFSDYMVITEVDTRKTDLYFYIRKNDIKICEVRHKKIFNASDPLLIPDLDRTHFVQFITDRRQKDVEEAAIDKRVGEYDKAHRNLFQKDLRGFFLSNEHRNNFAEYINCNYNKLSKYSHDFQKTFLCWIEPELF